MATLTTTRRSGRAPSSRPVRTWGRRPEIVTARRPPREQRLAEAKAREASARRELGLAVTRLERTYAMAVRRYEELDGYLATVRGRMRHAGYLTS
jgi:hypothetical protein